VVAYRLEKVPLDVVCALLRKTPLLLQTTSDVIENGFFVIILCRFIFLSLLVLFWHQSQLLKRYVKVKGFFITDFK